METNKMKTNRGQWITASALLLGTIAVLNMDPLTVIAQDTYTVQAGDNIYAIAQEYGVTEADIQAWNGMGNNTFIDIGDVLHVSGDMTEGPVKGSDNSGEASGNVYHVMPGDNLYRIAVENGTTEEHLMAINGLSTNLLQIGQQIVLAGEVEETPEAPTTPNEPVNDGVHVVVAGDNLYDIGLAYGATEDELMAWNGLSTNLLQIGDRIVVVGDAVETPTAPPSNDNSKGDSKGGAVYVVQPGDNLYRIAVDHGTTEEHLLAINGLSSNLLQIGQEIALSGEVMETPEEAPVQPEAPADPVQPEAPEEPKAPEEANVHVVVAGDNLYRIAADNGKTEEELMAINGLSNNLLQIGQRIALTEEAAEKPAEPTQPEEPATPEAPVADEIKWPIIHVVVQGDNTFRIAEQYGIKEEELFEWNEITAEDVIQPGDEIIVSNPYITPTIHTVVQGDTLALIAETYSTSTENIIEWNKLSGTIPFGTQLFVTDPNPDTHRVEPGQTLTQISELYGITIEEVRTWNKLPDTTLIVNGVLVVSDPTGMSGNEAEAVEEAPAPAQAEETSETNEATEETTAPVEASESTE